MFIPSYKKPASGGSYVPPTWSDGTDAEIVGALEKHYAGDIDLTEFWSVGDERVVHLSNAEYGYDGKQYNAQDITLVLTEVGGKYLADGITECAFQVDFKDCLITNNLSQVIFYDGTWGSSSKAGYSLSGLYTWMNTYLLGMFPETLQSIFKSFVYTASYSNYFNYRRTYSTPTVTSLFALRAVKEITGDTSVYDEGEQVEYYKTSANRIKNMIANNTTSADSYWTRTMVTNDYSQYYLIATNGTDIGQYYYNRSDIAPFSVI